jgi:hypothetical protein
MYSNTDSVGAVKGGVLSCVVDHILQEFYTLFRPCCHAYPSSLLPHELGVMSHLKINREKLTFALLFGTGTKKSDIVVFISIKSIYKYIMGSCVMWENLSQKLRKFCFH